MHLPSFWMVSDGSPALAAAVAATDPQAVSVVFSWVIPTLLHQG